MIVFLFSKPQLFPFGYFPTRLYLLQITICKSRGEITVLHYKDLTEPRGMSGAELFLLQLKREFNFFLINVFFFFNANNLHYIEFLMA